MAVRWYMCWMLWLLWHYILSWVSRFVADGLVRIWRQAIWNHQHHSYITLSEILIMMTSSNGNSFPRYWPFVWGIHRSPVNSPHKVQWRGALMFSLVCVWINDWVNNHEAGDLRRSRAHYDVSVMMHTVIWCILFYCIYVSVICGFISYIQSYSPRFLFWHRSNRRFVPMSVKVK